MDAKDLKSSLAYSMNYEAARTVSKTSRHVRSIETEDHMSRERDDKFEFFFNRLERLLNSSVAGKKNTPRRYSNKGVLVAAALVDIESETIPVRVLNLNNKPNILDKGADCHLSSRIFWRTTSTDNLDNLKILDEEQQTAVRKLLKEFQNLFSTCDAEIGRCNMTQHKINTGDHLQIKQYQRSLPLARKEEADHLVKEMVGNGIIEESSGPWVRLLCLLKRKIDQHDSL
ncbi:hypothetical protein AVEN_131345-1 [Araneus ventricosus]|uniref:Peptidase A9 domain-containing protein n=1 Tax=Araneus ventricosus TaxID=182803 RepID=A0A4Y2ECV0_ARAVE|nr:hypothetical protein AVEN_131345-1 [Araneus ventricosus]